MADVEAMLEKARKRHDIARAEIADVREALNQRDEAEAARWEKEKKKLETELKRAGE